MTWHAIILCEGAHDVATIVSLASTLDGWRIEKAVPKSLPQELGRTYPEPTMTRWGAPRFDPLPRYLRDGDRWIEVRQLGGVHGVLGSIAVSLLEYMMPHAVGVVVDANASGVPARLDAFKNRYAPLYAHADAVNAGTVCDGQPRLGFWVAPDNKSGGNLLDLLLAGAVNVKPQLIEKGKQFVASLETVEPGEWSSHWSKAVLGAIGQTVKPGASLAAALEASQEMFVTCACENGPLKQLRRFIQDLVRPSDTAA